MFPQLHTLSLRLLPLAASLALSACGGGGAANALTPQSGDIDLTLNGGQVVNTILSPVSIKDMAVQADGKIILVGTRVDPTETALLVMRLNVDGTPDLTFRNNGQFSFHAQVGATLSEDHGEAVAIQADGQIVIGGWTRVGANSATYMLLRLNAVDGQLDTTFASNGFTLESDESGFDRELRDIAIQTDGKIVVSGVIRNRSAGTDDTYVTRFEADGSESAADFLGANGALLNTGSLTVPGASNYESNASVSLDASGNILLAGTVSSNGSTDRRGVAFRLLPTGFTDGSYGDGGGAKYIDLGEEDVIHGAVTNPNGKLLLVGARHTGATTDALTIRMDATGQLDVSFNGTGSRVLPTAVLETARAVVLAGTQAYVLASSGAIADRNFVLYRINADGTTDTAFGTQGSILVNFGGDDRARAAALAPDGKIVIAGISDVTGQDDAVVSRHYP